MANGLPFETAARTRTRNCSLISRIVLMKPFLSLNVHYMAHSFCLHLAPVFQDHAWVTNSSDTNLFGKTMISFYQGQSIKNPLNAQFNTLNRQNNK